MKWLKTTMRTYFVWIGGLTIFIAWTIILGFNLPTLSDMQPIDGPVFGFITGMIVIAIYSLTALSLYHLGLKNLPNGKRKAKYWFLIGYSLFFIFDEDRKKSGMFQKVDDFMYSLLI